MVKHASFISLGLAGLMLKIVDVNFGEVVVRFWEEDRII